MRFVISVGLLWHPRTLRLDSHLPEWNFAQRLLCNNAHQCKRVHTGVCLKKGMSTGTPYDAELEVIGPWYNRFRYRRFRDHSYVLCVLLIAILLSKI